MQSSMQKLKGKIVERNTTQEAIADAIGINRATFYRKVKANGDSFTIKEAKAIVDALALSNQEAIEIFLPSMSQ